MAEECENLIVRELVSVDDGMKEVYSEAQASDQELSEKTEKTGVQSRPTKKDVFTVEEAIEKLGFGPFQILITVFSGMLWVVFVGFLLGGLLAGFVTDAIGRKMTLLVVDVWILVFGILSAIKVAPDDPSGKAFGYPWLLICRLGVGFGAGGTAQAVTYYAEFLPNKARGYCLIFLEVWWAIGSMFGALLALGVMNRLGWHWYLGIATFPLFLVLFLFPFVPESARFYLMKGKPKKAKAVLRKVAWFNRKQCPQGEVVSVEKKSAITEDQEISVSYNPTTGVSFESQLTPSTMESEEDTPLLDEDENCDEETKSTKVTQSPPQYKATYTQHLKERALTSLDIFAGGLWKTTLLLWILWIGCGWIYYGVVLLTTSIFQDNNHCFSASGNNETTECENMDDSFYLKIFWTSLAELPGLIVTILIIEVLGRKKTIALESTIAMIGFLLLFICTTPALTTLFLFVIRAFATGLFQAVYVYTPEVYATSVRATALGLHTSAARIGALLTPFNAQVLFHFNDIASVSLYAVSCLIMALASLLLPIETKGRSMKDGVVH